MPCELEDEGDEAGDRGDGGAEVPEADAGEEHHRAAAGEKQDRGAEVRLLHDERDRHHDEEERQDHPEEPRDLLRREPVVVGGERHHQGDLHHLGGLDLDRAEVDPALRAHADHAHHVDGDEEEERDGVGEGRHQPPEADVDHADDDHAGDADREADHLGLRPRLEGAVGDRVEHEEAGAGDRGEEDDERPVDREELRHAARDAAAGRGLEDAHRAAPLRPKRASARELRPAKPKHCFGRAVRRSA